MVLIGWQPHFTCSKPNLWLTADEVPKTLSDAFGSVCFISESLTYLRKLIHYLFFLSSYINPSFGSILHSNGMIS